MKRSSPFGWPGRYVRRAAMALLLVLGAGLAAASQTGHARADQAAVPSELSSKSLLIHATRAGERIVAVGEWGHIVLSDDKGKSWRQAESVPTRNMLTSVSFTDPQNGWAVGYDALILYTSDGGENWVEQYRGTEEDAVLLSVWFENSTHGLAVGAFGLTLETSDGGTTWTPRPLIAGSEDDFHLNYLFDGPDGALFIAAEAGFVYRSLDKGASWEFFETGYEGSFWSGLEASDGGVLVMGMRGNVYRSDDRGETWSAIETGTKQSLANGVVLEDGRLVAVGLAGTVLSSTDNGHSFGITSRKDRKGYSTVLPGADGEVLLFGEAGVLHHKLDDSAS